MSALHRNVLILGAAQAIGLAAAPLVILVGGLVASTLAPTASLTTLPIATLIIGVATNSVPAALLMKHVGRRAGSVTGALLGVGAALLAAWAVSAASFVAFCAATLLIGAHLAFVQQYRFAAVESVPAASAGRAVSYVLLGGVVAGLLGPEVANATRGMLSAEYAGSFVALALLCGVLAVLLLALRDVRPASSPAESEGARSLRALLASRDVAVAVAAGVVAFGVMSFIMTATPISMHMLDGHSVAATARVIQSHAVAMYLPSLFTGAIIARLGVRRVMAAGAIAMLGCVGVAIASRTLLAYWTALVLLGIGWNFLFVGGTVLLAASYRAAERFKAQATNDFLMFGVQAAAALSAGAVLDLAGWRTLNLITAPILVSMLLLIAVHARRASTPTAPAGTQQAPGRAWSPG
jgi:fucose permease